MKRTGTDGLSKTDLDTILERIRHFCAYQERCAFEIDQKLRQWKVSEAKIAKIMILLRKEGFLNEERFARIFVRSKFHINKWGRAKIRYELKSRNIHENTIIKALEEISADDYLRTVRELVLRKQSEIISEKHLNFREKIITFVTGKGFEFDLVLKVITELKI
jgi:regulatory protein